MHTKHQGTVCGTEDEDGFILYTTGMVAGTEDLALHVKAPGEVLGLNLRRLCLRKTYWSPFPKAPEA